MSGVVQLELESMLVQQSFSPSSPRKEPLPRPGLRCTPGITWCSQVLRAASALSQGHSLTLAMGSASCLLASCQGD